MRSHFSNPKKTDGFPKIDGFGFKIKLPLRISYVGRAEINALDRVPVTRRKPKTKCIKNASKLQTQRATVAKKLEKPDEKQERASVAREI